ncbi:MAG: hypothetical protein R3C16_05420 [Hyphomonadaceae bacterium]
MSRLGAALFFVALALIGPSAAQTADEAGAIARAERVGRDLYEHDRAAWLATDAAMAELSPADRAPVRGWVTERDGEAVVVTFVAADGEGDAERLRAAYRAVFRGGALTERGAVHAALTERQTQLYNARQAVVTAPPAICASPYNAAVLPRADEDVVDIYLMPATTRSDVLRVGGFVRVGFNLASGAVTEVESFSRSCLEFPLTPQAAGLFFTHLTSATPTETHVFLNLSTGVPLFVSIDRQIWQIENGRISLMAEGSPT